MLGIEHVDVAHLGPGLHRLGHQAPLATMLPHVHRLFVTPALRLRHGQDQRRGGQPGGVLAGKIGRQARDVPECLVIREIRDLLQRIGHVGIRALRVGVDRRAAGEGKGGREGPAQRLDPHQRAGRPFFATQQPAPDRVT